MLAADEDLLLAGAIVGRLRSLRLTWLEAFCLVYFFWFGYRLADVARLAGCTIARAAQARDSVVRKAALALGFMAVSTGIDGGEPTSTAR